MEWQWDGSCQEMHQDVNPLEEVNRLKGNVSNSQEKQAILQAFDST